MGDNYKIKVHVEIEKWADMTTDNLRQDGVGIFERIIPAEQAQSIDVCEQILLQTNYAALRDAFAHHLSAVSRQQALEIVKDIDECEVKPYRVEGEIGRITFDSYWVEPSPILDQTTQALFPPLHAKEWYRTTGFKEIGLVYGTVEDSYRKSSALINRVRHQEEEGTPFRTWRENTEYEGRQMMGQMKQQAMGILAEHGFSPDGLPTETAVDRSEQLLVRLSPIQVEQAVLACAPEPDWVVEMTNNPVAYEDPTHSTQVSVDEVNVKRQKANRKGVQEPHKKGKYAHNTVAHIAQAGAVYIINSTGIVSILRLVLAFLLHNHLLQNNLIFFVDGQQVLYTAISTAFAWLPSMQVILDWYHLEKRCKEQLSLALKGRTIRNSLLEQLLPCLWHGCVDRAITLLHAVEPTQIKDQAAVDILIGYLQRNRPYLPCYAVRKQLGLRNSSNLGEKANDLIVSDRQKHNGMSWSKPGSAALAAVTALVRNREYKRWFQTGTLSFSFSPAG
ncbi:MAG: hypothetical protein AB1516_15225 [Pseudomonadota bacterium]